MCLFFRYWHRKIFRKIAFQKLTIPLRLDQSILEWKCDGYMNDTHYNRFWWKTKVQNSQSFWNLQIVYWHIIIIIFCFDAQYNSKSFVWYDFVSKWRERRMRYCFPRLIFPWLLSCSILSYLYFSFFIVAYLKLRQTHLQISAQIIDSFICCHFHLQRYLLHFNPSPVIRYLLTEVLWGLSSVKANFLHFLCVSLEFKSRASAAVF